MLEKAAEKLAQLKDDPSLPPIRLEQRNLSEHRLENASVVILNYTLQFIRPAARQALLTQIYQALVPGGALILSEKLKSENPQLDRLMVEIYHNFKSSQGYSALEISQKREALENVLIPFSAEENIELLRASGFSTMEMALRWFNFATFIAIK